MNFLFKNYIHFTTEEAQDILFIRNEAFVRKNMYNRQIITLKEHFSWLNTLRHKSDRCYWGIYCDKQLIGSIDLTHINFSTMWAEWGFFIDEGYLGMGAVIEFLGMEHFFKALQFKNILACVHEKNKRVYHLHKTKFGYEEAPQYNIKKDGQNFYGLTLSVENWERCRTKIKGILDKLYVIDAVVWEDLTAINVP